MTKAARGRRYMPEGRLCPGKGSVIDPWQDVAGEQIRFGLVRISGQDEGIDTKITVHVQLRQNLIGIADDRRAASRPCTTDAGP